MFTVLFYFILNFIIRKQKGLQIALCMKCQEAGSSNQSSYTLLSATTTHLRLSTWTAELR
jgi:hypothetical protein